MQQVLEIRQTGTKIKPTSPSFNLQLIPFAKVSLRGVLRVFGNSDYYGNYSKISCCIPLQRWLLLLGAVLSCVACPIANTNGCFYFIYAAERLCLAISERSVPVDGEKGFPLSAPPLQPCTAALLLPPGAGGGM